MLNVGKERGKVVGAEREKKNILVPCLCPCAGRLAGLYLSSHEDAERSAGVEWLSNKYTAYQHLQLWMPLQLAHQKPITRK